MTEYGRLVSNLPLLSAASAGTSPRRTVWRRWNRLSRLQRSLVYFVSVSASLVAIYLLTWQDVSIAAGQDVAPPDTLRHPNPHPAAPVEPKQNVPRFHVRSWGVRADADSERAAENVVNQMEQELDAAGNKVQRVNRVVQLHQVRRVGAGDEEGDDDPGGGVRGRPMDPERDDLDQPQQRRPPGKAEEEPLIPARWHPHTPLSFPGATNARQEAVVAAFQHAWRAYKEHAWGHDHLKPISKQAHDWFGLGLTLVDSLDTMYIMNLKEEFGEARDWVASSLNLDVPDFVNLFETTIRVLGGLLSAHHLSQDQVFLDKAVDLGDRLLVAFDTPSGIPLSDVNLQSRRARGPAWNPDSSTAEVATLQLEFNQLSYVTGDPKYSEKVMAVSRHISGLPKREGLVPIYIGPRDGQFRQYSVVTLGARGDSYYEYLIKQYAQLGRPAAYLRDDFNASVQGIQHLLVKKSQPSGLTFLAELMAGGKNVRPKMDHLACFLPGTLALSVRLGLPASYMKLAQDLLHTCYQTYSRQPTFLAPEITLFNMNPDAKEDFYVKSLDSHNLLRPETVESLWYLYHLTGNKTYQDWGWNIFQAFEKYTKVASGGYSSINSVLDADNVSPRDSMESFFLGETLKYLYLLFSDDQRSVNLADFVFNSEAHPLPVLRPIHDLSI